MGNYVDHMTVTGESGCPAIDDTSKLPVEANGLTADLDIVDGQSPVGVADDWVVGPPTSSEGWVNTAKDQLATSLICLCGKVEGETVVINLPLLVHKVEHGWQTIDGDPLPRHSEDTIKMTDDERKPFHCRHLTKVHILDLLATPCHIIDTYVPLNTTRAVQDIHSRSIFVVGAGLPGVVGVVKETGNVPAVRRRNPQVARPGVENNLEVLRRGPNANLAIELGVHVVIQINWEHASLRSIYAWPTEAFVCLNSFLGGVWYRLQRNLDNGKRNSENKHKSQCFHFFVQQISRARGQTGVLPQL
jgi:hypothetical protein